MAYGPFISWQIEWEKVEAVTDNIFFLVQKSLGMVTVVMKHLLLGRKAMTSLDSELKSRDITLPTKVILVKVMVFPVVMYGCESWTIKKLNIKELMVLNCISEDS